MAEDVDWKNAGAQHMLDTHGIAPGEADEAINDVDSIWADPDPRSRSGNSARVIGYSHTRAEILTLILVHREDGNGWYGANGWASNSTERRMYREEAEK